MNAMAGSATAMSIVVNNDAGMNAILNSQTALNAIVGNANAMNYLVNSDVSMNKVVNSQVAMNAVVSTSTAISYVVGSVKAMGYIVKTSIGLNTSANNQVMITAIANSDTAATIWLNSNGSRYIASSSICQTAFMNDSNVSKVINNQNGLNVIMSDSSLIRMICTSTTKFTSLCNSSSGCAAFCDSQTARTAMYDNASVTQPVIQQSVLMISAMKARSVTVTANKEQHRIYINKKCFMLGCTTTVYPSEDGCETVYVFISNDLLTKKALEIEKRSTSEVTNLPVNRFMTATTTGEIYIDGGYTYRTAHGGGGAAGVDGLSCVYFVI